MNLMTIDLQ